MSELLKCISQKPGCGRHKANCAAIEELPVAYMELNAEGVVIYANPAAQQMHDPALG